MSACRSKRHGRRRRQRRHHRDPGHFWKWHPGARRGQTRGAGGAVTNASGGSIVGYQAGVTISGGAECRDQRRQHRRRQAWRRLRGQFGGRRIGHHAGGASISGGAGIGILGRRRHRRSTTAISPAPARSATGPISMPAARLPTPTAPRSWPATRRWSRSAWRRHRGQRRQYYQQRPIRRRPAVRRIGQQHLRRHDHRRLRRRGCRGRHRDRGQCAAASSARMAPA